MTNIWIVVVNLGMICSVEIKHGLELKTTWESNSRGNIMNKRRIIHKILGTPA